MSSLPPPSVPTGPATTSYLRVTTKYPILAFLYVLFGTEVVIDGHDLGKQKYGTLTVPVAPGTHTVQLAAKYAFYTRFTRNSVVVDVPAGATVGVRYKAPYITLMKGRIVDEGVVG